MPSVLAFLAAGGPILTADEDDIACGTRRVNDDLLRWAWSSLLFASREAKAMDLFESLVERKGASPGCFTEPGTLRRSIGIGHQQSVRSAGAMLSSLVRDLTSVRRRTYRHGDAAPLYRRTRYEYWYVCGKDYIPVRVSRVSHAGLTPDVSSKARYDDATTAVKGFVRFPDNPYIKPPMALTPSLARPHRQVSATAWQCSTVERAVDTYLDGMLPCPLRHPPPRRNSRICPAPLWKGATRTPIRRFHFGLLCLRRMLTLNLMMRNLKNLWRQSRSAKSALLSGFVHFRSYRPSEYYKTSVSVSFCGMSNANPSSLRQSYISLCMSPHYLIVTLLPINHLVMIISPFEEQIGDSGCSIARNAD